MAATGKTPILLYGSTTATNVPVAGNLTNSSDGCEIAINVADKNLFFKDSTNAVNTVPIRQSSGSSDGWLSSANWTTFNSKQAAYTNLTSIGSLANTTGWLYNNGSGTFSYSTPSASDVGAVPTTRTISTTSPLAGGGDLSANRTFSITQATTSTDGYLSSTDWNTFNNKANAFTYTSNYIPYGQGTTTPNQSSALTFNGTSLQTTGTFYSTGTTGLTWNGGSASTAQVVIGTTGSASSVFINTPSVNSLYGSGLGIDGTYSSTNSVIQLHAYGAKSGGGYNGSFSFWTSYLTTETEQFTIASNTGNVTVKTGNLVIGTSGKGIDFSATAGTGTSELLADYEEGTWTPTLTAGTGSITSYTATGLYTKVGRLVTVAFNSTITNAGTGGGALTVSGLPYTNNASVVYYGCGRENALTGYMLQAGIGLSGTSINVITYSNTSAIATNAQIRVTITYSV